MNCLWADIPNSEDERGWRRVKCVRYGCGRESGLTPHSHDRIFAKCRATDGPGTELKKILDSLGIEPKNNCQCAARQQEMDNRGIEGCRQTREEILGWLREGYDQATLTQKLRGGANALVRGLPTTLEGLLDLATELAATHLQSQSQQ